MRIEIDIDDARPPSGTVQLLDGAGETVAAPFAGWLSLLRALEDVLARSDP